MAWSGGSWPAQPFRRHDVGMSAAWKGGSTRAWRQVRAAVLLRDGYRCRIGRPGCTGVASQVDHIHGKARCRGCAVHHPTHLRAACAHCNAGWDPGRVRAAARVLNASAVTRW